MKPRPLSISGIDKETLSRLKQRAETHSRVCGVRVSLSAYVRLLIQKDLRTMRQIEAKKRLEEK